MLNQRQLGIALGIGGSVVAFGIPLLGSQPVEAASQPVVAVGAPARDVNGQKDAGVVQVRLASGKTQVLVAPGYRAGDRFGTAVDRLDVTNDGVPDLFVGAPGRAVSGKAGAGVVYLYRGSATGFTYYKTFAQGSVIGGPSQAGAGFGSAIDADTDIETTILVGAPGYDIGTATDAGAANDIYIEKKGSSPTFEGVLVAAANWAGVKPAAGDRFGTSVLFDEEGVEVYGAPGRTVDGKAGAGAVFTTNFEPDTRGYVLTQNTEGMPDVAEAGDNFGASLVQGGYPHGVYVGAPNEDVGTVKDAGLVNTVSLSDLGSMDPGPAYTQNSYDDVAKRPVPGTAEAGDRFGSSLTTAFAGDSGYTGVLVGAPSEDLGTAADAGIVIRLGKGTSNYTGASVGGRDEAGDRFGTAMLSGSSGGVSFLGFGVPGEDGGKGLVSVVIPGKAAWTLAGASTGDGYGSSMR